MSHANGIITAPVSIEDVKLTIGCASNDLGTLCAKAKKGGKSGYAFNIVENGGTVNSGELLADSSPYWNLYSNESPGEWLAATSADGPLIMELKRFLGDRNKGYGFGLHHFDGYNHNAAAPFPGGQPLEFTEGAGSGSVTYTVTLKPNTGSYNWAKISGATLFQSRVYNGSILMAQSTPVAISSGTVTISVPLTINTASVGVFRYKTRLYIGSGSVNAFNSLGYIPVEGEITVTITAKPVITASVRVSGRVNVFAMAEGVTSNNTTRFSGTYRLNSGVTTDGKTLRSMTYSWGSAAAGNEGSLTVTSFNFREGPSYLRSYSAGDNVETFTSDPARVPRDFINSYQVLFVYE